jgi:anti-sigma B factor antagonist
MHWTEISSRSVGDIIVLDLHGHMTLSDDDEPRLVREVRRMDQTPPLKVLLNLQQVGYIDSTGVGEIVGAYTRVVRNGGTLKLCGVSPRIRELLETTNLDTVIETFAAEADAVRSFG